MFEDATGLLVDTALSIIQWIIPEPSIEERRAALMKASKLALSNGITSVVDFGRTTPQGPPEQPWDDFKGTLQFQECFLCFNRADPV